MITQEQAEVIKNQIITQIEKSFPADKKEFAKEKIMSMSPDELEIFLKQNKLVAETQTQSMPLASGSCVFCSIVSENIQAYKIAENSDALAVLEINPVSRGHALIIPKNHVISSAELKGNIFSLVKKVSKTLKSKLKPQNITITSSNVMGHEIINVIPVYENKETSQERHQANPEELLQLQSLLTKTKAKRAARKPRKIQKMKEERLRLPRRIP